MNTRGGFDLTRLPPTLARAVEALGLTVVRRTVYDVTVVCPHCGRERPVTHSAVWVWLKQGRVPDCRNARRRMSCQRVASGGTPTS